MVGTRPLQFTLELNEADRRRRSDRGAWGPTDTSVSAWIPSLCPLPGLSLPLVGALTSGVPASSSASAVPWSDSRHHLHQGCFFPSQHPLYNDHLSGHQGMALFPGDPTAPPPPPAPGSLPVGPAPACTRGAGQRSEGTPLVERTAPQLRKFGFTVQPAQA